MRKSARRAMRIRGAAMATVLASLTIAMTSLPTVAQAGDNWDSTESLDVAIPADSILATPEEVALLGGTPDEVRTQEHFWPALPADVAQEQATLNAAEHSRYQAAFDNIIPASMDFYASREVAGSQGTTATPSGTMSPNLGPIACGGSYLPYYYKVQDIGVNEWCFYGPAGTHEIADPKPNDIAQFIEVSPGTTTGRVYYQVSGQAYYWSVTRGNTQAWFNFDPTYEHYDMYIKVYRVQTGL